MKLSKQKYQPAPFILSPSTGANWKGNILQEAGRLLGASRVSYMQTEVILPAPRGNPHLCHCSSSQAISQRPPAQISTAWQKVSFPENVKTVREKEEKENHMKKKIMKVKKYRRHKWKVNVPNAHSYCHNISGLPWFAFVLTLWAHVASCEV